MPEPDFDQIAECLVGTIEGDDVLIEQPDGSSAELDVPQLVRDVAAQLRQVWNARPVTRCDQCRFWLPDELALTGDCRVLSDDPNIAEEHKWPEMIVPDPKAVVAPFAGADGGGLITDADFGCVQWEAKP